MFDFKLKTEIHRRTWDSFIKDFHVGAKDVIITSRPILDQCLMHLLPCRPFAFSPFSDF